MEKDMNRAARRHHSERLKHTRRFYHGRDLVHDPVQLGKTVATPANCTCASCGNPRKYRGERTVQELRAMQEPQLNVESPPWCGYVTERQLAKPRLAQD